MFPTMNEKNLEAIQALGKFMPGIIAAHAVELGEWWKESLAIPTVDFIKGENFFVKKAGEGMDAKISGWMHELNIHGDCTCGKDWQTDFLHYFLYQAMQAWYNKEKFFVVPGKFFQLVKKNGE